MSNQELINKAIKAMENSYAPYSKFNVGAALITSSGLLYSGCNIENASFGATICAERTAIFKAVSEGHKDIAKIAVVCRDNRKAVPCGICLQVMNEFMPDGSIVLCDGSGVYEYKLKELLPAGFAL